MAIRVAIEEVQADEREFTMGDQQLLRGRTLASLVDELGGYDGELTDPLTGERLEVSLAKWRDRDPESTWLAVSFISE